MVAIQVLGISGHRSTKKLIDNAGRAIEELNLRAKIEEVTDLDFFINYDISGVPAMLINGKLAVQKTIPGVEDLKTIIKDLNKPLQNKRKMKKIVVPTDFSSSSHEAFLFAKGLAPYLGATIEVVHVFSGSFSTQRPFTVKAGMGHREALLQDLQYFVKAKGEGSVQVSADVKIDCQVIGGNTEKELLKLAKKDDTLMLVMGMTGEGASTERLFGSVSKVVSEKSNCPVLLIPRNVQFEKFRHILFASDYASVKDSFLKKAIEFSAPFKSTLHFIHVSENKEDPDVGLEYKLFNFLFADGDPTYAFNMATIDADSVPGGLNKYIEENKVDLMIMVTHHRNFWQRLTHKSVTKAMAGISGIPLLVFHTDLME